jgi:Ca-activated chloride channel family protein
MSRTLTLLAALGLALAPALASAQGVLVVVDSDHVVKLPRPIIIWPPHPHPPHPIPRPIPEPVPTSYKVKEVEVQAKLVDQVAQVQMSQTFENTGSRQLEATFVFPLPYDGAIEQMTLMVDGKEYPAKLLDAKEARKLYEDIVRKNKDPALLEWMGTGLFKTSVFPVPPGAKRTVTLRYSQLLRKQDGLTDFLFPLSTAKYSSHPVEKIDLRVTIESQEEIKNIYSPTHGVEVKRPDNKRATITYASKDEVPTNDFRLFYDVGKGKVSTKVLSYRPEKDEDGFFMLLTSPRIEAKEGDRPRKTVVFVIDRSGSMSGKKIEQVRSALKDVLGKLRDGDLFNVVAYDSQVETFRPELQKFNETSRKAAMGFVEGLYAGGSTNIEAALKTALGLLQDNKQPAYVVFLTDGLPTVGETSEPKIIQSAKENNKVRARVFSFGVGYDVNSRLLDKLARESFGQSEYVRPDEDVETAVAKLYNRIESPVLTEVKIEFAMDVKPEEGSVVNRVYPKDSFDLFAGEQLVVVGRYKKAGTAKVVVSGKVGDDEQKFDFPAKLLEKSKDDSNGFIEKLWAVRRVGEILDEIDLKGKNEELVKELVALSTKHGILTPYTAFMADDTTNIRDVAANAFRAGERLDALAATDGAAGVAQRAMKGSYQRAAAPAAAPMADSRGLDRFAAEAGGGIGGGGRAGFSGPPTATMRLADEAKRESVVVQQNVRNIGNRTFFRRDNQWVDSRVTKEQETNARRVRQFSDEYFELANRHGRAMSQYMAFDEPVLLNFGSEAYLIEP